MMSTNQTERPHFYEGQYLGAQDLEDVLCHARIHRARHLLGAHTWGIAAGLQLVEITSASGSGELEVHLQPGYAWDGFGRPIVVLTTFKIPASKLKPFVYDAAIDDGDPKGRLIPVWLRYCESEYQSPSPGFDVCASERAYTRIRECFALEIGERSTHAEQHDTVSVAGYQVDAQRALRVLDPDAPLVYDEAIPHQALPAEGDPARWLIPLGYVRWKPDADRTKLGEFVEMSDDDHERSRRFRRYAGVVADALLAADGTLRLRDRGTDPGAAVWSGDLVWVEGDLRADADVKLFGGKLHFRDTAGEPSSDTADGVPLRVQRREDNGLGGKDLQVVIGQREDGDNRLVVGPETKDGLKERLVVRDDGHVGVGTGSPEYDVQIGDGSKPVALCLRGAGGTAEAAVVHFQDDAGETQRWLKVVHDTDENKLRVVSAERDPLLVVERDSGDVGIGTADPARKLHVVGDRIRLENGDKRLDLRADGGAVDLQSDSHTLYVHSSNHVLINPFAGQGNVGVGTENPARKLHVVGDRIRLQNGGKHVDLRADGMAVDLHSETNHLYLRSSGPPGNNNVIINPYGTDGDVGVGTEAPAVRLHVQDEINEAASLVSSHVACMENTSPAGNADVLALKVGIAEPTVNNNFITFFGGGAAVGRIEGNGAGGVTYRTNGADYAEYLPRLHSDERVEPGDVIGLFGGKISRSTQGADHVLVVSRAPLALGNCPADEQKDLYEKVTFLGQTPVKVRGPVRAGDYILPSGRNDGSGVAIPPREMAPGQYAQIVGRAWESCPEQDVKLVTAAVSLQPGYPDRALSALLEAQQEEIRALRAELEQLKAALVPA